MVLENARCGLRVHIVLLLSCDIWPWLREGKINGLLGKQGAACRGKTKTREGRKDICCFCKGWQGFEERSDNAE